jgi:fluoride ion exporter CrcB/FEX
MDPTKLRMRYLLGIFLAAVVTAAVLRHVLHTQVGIAREDIRTGVLIAAAVAIFLLVAFFRWGRRQ